MGFFDIPLTETALHAEADIAATIPHHETALHAEDDIVATQIM